MRNGDDLRGFVKVMEFIRAINILFIVINIYWFCYQSVQEWGTGIGVVNKVLFGFQRTAGLFSSILWTELFAVLFLALSCLGTKGMKRQKITWCGIILRGMSGLLLFFGNRWLLTLPLPFPADTVLHTAVLTTRYIYLLIAGLQMSRLLKIDLLEDVFNVKSESLIQGTELKRSEYSVNLRTRFWFRDKAYDGWISLVSPFRATMVLDTPGSDRSCTVINQYIKQTIEKGYLLFLYDFKYPDLSEVAYNHLPAHLNGYKVKSKFYVINLDSPRENHRCNPIHPGSVIDISDAYESAYTIVLNLSRTWIPEQSDLFAEPPIVLLASII